MTDTELLDRIEQLLVQGHIVKLKPTFLGPGAWQVGYKHEYESSDDDSSMWIMGGGESLRDALENVVRNVINTAVKKKLR